MDWNEEASKILKSVEGYCEFSSPVLDDDLLDAERALGLTLPPILRALYRRTNGIRNDIGEYLLFPLTSPSGWALVDTTRFIRKMLGAGDGSHYVGFGYVECWKNVAMRELPDENLFIAAFDPESDDNPQYLGSDLLTVYRENQRLNKEVVDWAKKNPNLVAPPPEEE